MVDLTAAVHPTEVRHERSGKMESILIICGAVAIGISILGSFVIIQYYGGKKRS